MEEKKETKLVKALRKDYKELYVKEYTTGWREQRLIRNIELGIMSLKNTEEYISQELDKAREEGYKKGRNKIDKSTPEEEIEESVWDMLEREEDGYIKEISYYWQKNGHKHIEIEIVPNEPDEPEKVYVDPIVPNFTEELSWPVEYKTRKQVKEMFKDTKKLIKKILQCNKQRRV